MGVDFYTCAFCQRTFPDCGPYFNCFCGEHFCTPACGGRQYIDPEAGVEEYTSCVLCRVEEVTNRDMLTFLLKHFNLTYDEAFELYKKE